MILKEEFIILQALASTLDEGELADLRDQFHAIDADKNGAISLEEMRQVCSILRLNYRKISFCRNNSLYLRCGVRLR